MLCKEIIEVIENTYPKHAAMGWDNVGLLVGRTEKEVKRIFVALEVTDEVLRKAIESGADMIVTHPPLIFSPLKRITDEHFIGSRVVKLLQHDISYYAMHTNYDVLGMAELSEKILGLCNAEVFEITDTENNKGIGRIGNLENGMTAMECCELVKQRFKLESVKLFGDRDAIVDRVALVPGSGSKMIDMAIQKKADVLISGDIDHHTGIDAVAQGLVVIDAGHYGLEYIFIEDMASYLEKHLKEVTVERAEIHHPFQVI